jgi:hypothetical protein
MRGRREREYSSSCSWCTGVKESEREEREREREEREILLTIKK